jgi:hypothetical protein
MHKQKQAIGKERTAMGYMNGRFFFIPLPIAYSRFFI